MSQLINCYDNIEAQIYKLHITGASQLVLEEETHLHS